MRNLENPPVEYVQINGVSIEKERLDEDKALFDKHMGPGSGARLIFYVSGKMTAVEKREFYNEMAQLEEAVFMELDETAECLLEKVKTQSPPVIPSMALEESMFARLNKVMKSKAEPKN